LKYVEILIGSRGCPIEAVGQQDNSFSKLEHIVLREFPMRLLKLSLRVVLFRCQFLVNNF
ncbi:MAG: hypothetical protein VX495_05210, partial [Nitrospinota bacterium]|nr:hypothetical protein [Nitrospinota bacterium]